MKNFTQKFIGLLALVLTMSFTTNAQTFPVYFESDVPIAGFQFELEGAEIIDAYGGASEQSGFTISSGSAMVIGFSLSGATIPAGDGILVELEIYGDAPCLNDIVFADASGNALPVYVENCNTIVVDQYHYLGCTDPLAFNYDPDATIYDGSCILPVYGCTGPDHCNYNSDATVDDGSCVYAMVGYDCDGNCLLEIDCMGECGGSAIEDECGECGGDGSECAPQDGIFEVYYQSSEYIAGFQFNLEGSDITSASGGAAGQNGFMMSTSPQVVVGFSLTGATISAGNGILVVLSIEGSSDACINNIVLSDASGNALPVYVENCNTIVVGYPEIYGCTDPFALNYDVDATIDDGSCILPVYGCTGPSHCNYNPDATVDDGSCVYAMEGYDCDGNCLLEIDCMGECGGSAIIDECGVCGGDGSSCPQSGCTDENGVFYDEGVQWSTDPCTLCSCEDGEIFCSTVDCAIPECEVPNYLDDVAGECCPVCVEVEPVSNCEQQDIPLNLPQGWSMFGYTCLESVDVIEAFADFSESINIVKDYLGNAYLPSWSFNAIGELQFARGYQIKMIETVEDFQFCTTPSVMQGSSQDEINAAYAEGAASVTPEDGITQADVDAAYSDGYSDGVESISTETVSIGDLHEGGIVFQINADGTGLVVIAEDLEELYPWPQAVSEAGEFTSGGYSDWYLPNSEELESMFSTIGPGTEENIGGFNESISYWSSTKYFGSYVWAVFFSNGNAYFQPESDTYKVRVIRSF